MITIQPSPSADSRTAAGNVTKEELLESSKMHISDVQKGMNYFAQMILEAAAKHDHTKIEYIDEFYEDFKTKKDGDFKAGKWFSERHLTERHHLLDRCPDDVNLIDVLERIADISMAGMARSGVVYDDELDPEILTKAFKNTLKLMISQIVVVDQEDHTDPIKTFADRIEQK